MFSSFPNDSNTQFTFSYELLILLRWLADHDAERLKKIIAKGLKSGLQDELRKAERAHQLPLMDDIHHSITDFFGLLESLLLEVISEQVAQKAREKDLMPAIDQIDSTICDDITVRSSLEKATSKMEHNPTANPKELLYKELLKRWKPHNKNVKN